MKPAGASEQRRDILRVLALDVNEVLEGIFTKRDLMAKVVAKGLDPRTIPVANVMTPEPRPSPDMLVSDAVLMIQAFTSER